jgi:hypothetical protein
MSGYGNTRLGSVLISGAKAFDRKGREELAEVAKKSAIEIRTLPVAAC